jgi:hypothetical protein
MDVGGFCAEGGAYAIEVHCPQGVAWMMPLSIFGMMIGGAIYAFNVVKGSTNFTYLFWTALFGALGWNFLDYAIFKGEQVDIGWLICGVMFWLMAFGPLFLLMDKRVARELMADNEDQSDIKTGYRILILIAQIIMIILGIFGGYLLVNYY